MGTLDQPPHLFLLAVDEHLDGAVAAVAHPAVEAQRARRVDAPAAIEDALDLAVDAQPEGRHGHARRRQEPVRRPLSGPPASSLEPSGSGRWPAALTMLA